MTTPMKHRRKIAHTSTEGKALPLQQRAQEEGVELPAGLQRAADAHEAGEATEGVLPGVMEVNGETVYALGPWVFDVLLRHNGTGTLEELKADLGVPEKVIMRWYDRDPEFREAVRLIRGLHVRDVELALYRRAVGYEVEEVTVTEDGEKKTVKTTRKHVPADVAAAKMWLVNRDPDRWSDKQQVEVESSYTRLLREAAQQVLELDEAEYREVTPDGPETSQ